MDKTLNRFGAGLLVLCIILFAIAILSGFFGIQSEAKSASKHVCYTILTISASLLFSFGSHLFWSVILGDVTEPKN